MPSDNQKLKIREAINLTNYKLNISDNKEGKHNKNDSDNIIKKCKAVLFKYIIIYVLDIVNKLRTNKEENFELLKLSYKKYIDKLKKKNELDLFILTSF